MMVSVKIKLPPSLNPQWIKNKHRQSEEQKLRM